MRREETMPFICPSNHMKTNHLFLFIPAVAAFCVRVFGAENPANPVLPPSDAMVQINVGDGASGPSRISGTENPANTMIGSALWIDIKDIDYSRRAAFFAGLNRLEAHANAQLNEVGSQRAAMKNSLDSKSLDLILEELNFARLRLKFASEASRAATPDTWNEQKEKVGQAWAQMQDALNLLKSPSI